MVTDIREFGSVFGSSLAREAESRLARVARQIRRVFCSVRGHEEFLQFEKNRLLLRCMSCGHESPGWVIGKNTPLAGPFGNRRSTVSSDKSERKAA